MLQASILIFLSLMTGIGTAQVCPKNVVPAGVDSGRETKSLDSSSTFYLSTSFNGPMHTDRPPEFAASAGNYSEFIPVLEGCWTTAYDEDSWHGVLKLPPDIPTGPTKIEIRAWGEHGGLALEGDDQDGPVAFVEQFVKGSTDSTVPSVSQRPRDSSSTERLVAQPIPNIAFEVWEGSSPYLDHAPLGTLDFSDMRFVAFAGGQYAVARNLEVLSRFSNAISTPLWTATVENTCSPQVRRSYFLSPEASAWVAREVRKSTAGWVTAQSVLPDHILRNDCITPKQKIEVLLSTTAYDTRQDYAYSDYPEAMPLDSKAHLPTADPLGPIIRTEMNPELERGLLLARGKIILECAPPTLTSPSDEVREFRGWKICALSLATAEILPRQLDFERLMRELRAFLPKQKSALALRLQELSIPESVLDRQLDPAWIRWRGTIGTAEWNRGEFDSDGAHLSIWLVMELDLSVPSITRLRLVASRHRYRREIRK